jgi:hypothetical protein
MTPATTQPDFIPDTAPPPAATSGAGSSPDFIPDFIPDTAPPPAAPRPDEVMPTVAQSTLQAAPPGTVVEGAWKKVKQLAAGLMDLANAPLIPGLATDPARNTALSPEVQALATHIRQNSAPTTPQEKAGGFGVDALALADPALWGEEGATAGMSLADHVAAIARNLKTLEKNPGLLNRLKNIAVDTAAGATNAAVPNATLAAVESGGDPEATAQAGLTGAAVGGILGGGASALREAGQAAVSKIESILASSAANEAAPSNFAAGATNTLQRALDRMGLSRIADPVADYGQAASQLEQHASSIYDEADRLTDGKWRSANAAVQAAKDTGNADAIARAQSRLDALSTGFDDANFGQAVKEATDRARDAFHDKFTLENIHDSLVKSFDFGTPETAAMRGSDNTFTGADLGKQLKNLETNPQVGRQRMVDLMGEDGLNSLYDLAQTAKNPAQNQRLIDVLKEIATRAHATGSKASWAGGMLGMFLPAGWKAGAGVGYGAGAAAGAADATAANLMKYVATKPRLVNLANYAAKNNVSTRYAATLIGAAISHEMERDQASTAPPAATLPAGVWRR